eukprot:scaffold170386_cov19-Prasinocladus_malaysianus.AAC.1
MHERPIAIPAGWPQLLREVKLGALEYTCCLCHFSGLFEGKVGNFQAQAAYTAKAILSQTEHFRLVN